MAQTQVSSISGRELGDKIKDLFVRAGGLFPKLGQNLAERPDLIENADIRDALKECQSDLTEIAMKEEEVTDVVGNIRLFAPSGDALLRGFNNTPLAAASIGQVHRLDGQSKVIKLINESQEIKVESQRRFVRGLASMDLTGKARMIAATVVAAFEEVMKEFDLNEEGAACIRGDDMLRGIGDKTLSFRVFAPAVHARAQRWLIMDDILISGNPCKLNDYLASPAVDLESRRKIFARVVVTWGHMILRHGFFHCDPHGGNVYVKSVEPNKTEICIIDWGGACALTPEIRKFLLDLLVGTKKVADPSTLDAVGLKFPAQTDDNAKLGFCKLLTSTIAHADTISRGGHETSEPVVPNQLPSWVVQLLRVMSMFGNYAHMLRGEDDFEAQAFHSDHIWLRLANLPHIDMPNVFKIKLAASGYQGKQPKGWWLDSHACRPKDKRDDGSNYVHLSKSFGGATWEIVPQEGTPNLVKIKLAASRAKQPEGWWLDSHAYYEEKDKRDDGSNYAHLSKLFGGAVWQLCRQ